MSTTNNKQMVESNLTQSEKLTIEFMEKQEKPVLKSHVGIQVGKRNSKNAAQWAAPILESLIKKGLVKSEEVSGKIQFSLVKVITLVISEPKTGKSKFVNAEDIKLVTNDLDTVIEESPLADELASNDLIEVAYDTKKEKTASTPRTNLLSNIDLDKARNIGLKKLQQLQKEDEQAVNKSTQLTIQKEVKKVMYNYFIDKLGEKSMRANLIKFTLRRLTDELVTGKAKPFKDDERDIVKGNKVLFIAKDKTQVIGDVVKVCFDKKIYNQKYYMVYNPKTDREEFKVPSKILKVVEG